MKTSSRCSPRAVWSRRATISAHNGPCAHCRRGKSNYSRSQLFCIRFLYDSATMEKLGVLLFAIDPDELSHTFSDVADGGLILGRDGIIYSSAGQYTVGNVYQDDSRGELFKT